MQEVQICEYISNFSEVLFGTPLVLTVCDVCICSSDTGFLLSADAQSQRELMWAQEKVLWVMCCESSR